jgi:preprotein translocase subunit SecB
MQIAAFSLVNYKFSKVKIDIENHQSGNLDISFLPRGEFSVSDSSYELIFDVNLAEKETPQMVYVSIQCHGFFKFEHVDSLEQIPDFFYTNCIAILFPYIRAYLSLVTTQANVPGVILPTLNLSHLESTLRANTIQK